MKKSYVLPVKAIEAQSIEFLRSNKTHPLCFYLIRSNELMHHMCDPGTGGDGQKVIHHFVKHAVRRLHADACAVVSESFYASLDRYMEKGFRSRDDAEKDVEKYRDKHGSVKGHPLALDSLVISFQTAGFRSLRVYTFEFNKSGRPDDFRLVVEQESDDEEFVLTEEFRTSSFFYDDLYTESLIESLSKSGDPSKVRLAEQFCENVMNTSKRLDLVIDEFVDSDSDEGKENSQGVF